MLEERRKGVESAAGNVEACLCMCQRVENVEDGWLATWHAWRVVQESLCDFIFGKNQSIDYLYYLLFECNPIHVVLSGNHKEFEEEYLGYCRSFMAMRPVPVPRLIMELEKNLRRTSVESARLLEDASMNPCEICKANDQVAEWVPDDKENGDECDPYNACRFCSRGNCTPNPCLPENCDECDDATRKCKSSK